jgi:rubrerythrin
MGYEFYTHMSKKFDKDESLRKLFNDLALREQQHEMTFSKLREKVTDEIPEGWEEAAHYLRAIVESEFFLGKNKFLPSLQNVQSAHDAVRFAMGFEKETLLYFHTLRDMVKDKDVVDEIIKEEKRHLRELAKLLRSTSDK